MRAAISFCFGVSLLGQRLEPGGGVPDRHLGDLADMQSGDLHRQRLRLQPIALAGVAKLLRLVARQLLGDPGQLRLAPAPLDIVDHALERLGGGVMPHAVVIGEGDLVLAGAVEHDFAEILRQRLPRLGHGLAIGAGEQLERLRVIGRARAGARPGRDGAARKAQVFVGHHEVGLEEQLGAEPVAFGARAIRIVEGEQPGLDLLDGEAGFGAGEFRREDDALRCLVRDLGDDDALLAQAERRLEAIGETRSDIAAHHDAVDHHVDIVLVLLVEGRGLGDLVELAVDLEPLEALLLQLDELLPVFAFPPARDRRQEIEPRAFGQRQHAIHHLAHRLALDGEPGRGRVGHADPRPEQPHIVVDLGDRADRRTRVLRGGLLLDGDGRRQALDMVDVGLLHHVEELPRIGRQRLDIAPLALGIDRVEGERGLAGARESGDHHERLARQIERDILEIVLARAADGDEFGGHSLRYVGLAQPLCKA